MPSDRQLVYWIHYLETDPLVKWFDLTPEKTAPFGQEESRGTELHAEVYLHDGSNEWHEVKASGSQLTRPEPLAPYSATMAAPPKHRIFSDSELKPHVRSSMHWLKALNFAATIRDQKHTHVLLALLNFLQIRKLGIVRHLSSDLADYDPPVLQGLLVRLAVQGHVDLDLTAGSFSYSTSWRWRGGKDYVES